VEVEAILIISSVVKSVVGYKRGITDGGVEKDHPQACSSRSGVPHCDTWRKGTNHERLVCEPRFPNGFHDLQVIRIQSGRSISTFLAEFVEFSQPLVYLKKNVHLIILTTLNRDSRDHIFLGLYHLN